MTSVSSLLQFGKKILSENENEYAKYESKVLLEEVLGISYMQMLLNPDMPVTEDQEKQYKNMIEQRCNHYPLQYILGYAHFMDYTFIVDENVLIPRSDTEILVETADELLNSYELYQDGKVSLLDMCCGSGCIGISLKLYHSDLDLYLCDISKKTLDITKKNLEKYNVTGHLIESDLFQNIHYHYSMIVCNPPYIERDFIPTLMPEVKDYEPVIALDGGNDGLDFYRAILTDGKQYLDSSGYLLFEIGYNQGQAVYELMMENGFLDVQVKKDYAGLDRVVFGHL
ncbi:MAG: peptide chain release factor N(5)-glutamine methyltransferase [Lachnospiraceae bacterium]